MTPKAIAACALGLILTAATPPTPADDTARAAADTGRDHISQWIPFPHMALVEHLELHPEEGADHGGEGD